MKKLITSFLLLTLPLLASAYDCQVDGIYYKLKKSAKTAEVTYQLYESSSHSYMSDYSGSVTIPEKFTFEGVEYSVTSIGNYAFSNCTGLTSVTIPNSVLSIGNRAFADCCGLTNITIPSSVTSIGDGTFSGCIGLTSITIPNSVTSIGAHAFYGCSGLTSVTIPNSVISLGEYTFYGCKSLNSVTIGNSVNSIGKSAFSFCVGLTSMTIGNSVTSIGNYAFDNCESLTTVTIPNSVITIGSDAFAYCNALTSVTIPNSVTSIGSAAFLYCSNLTSVIIPNSVTSIGSGAFAYCSALTSVTIPNSVTSIGASAFLYCSNLTSVIIPNSVTSIEYNAFKGCTSLTSVTIPNSVTSIEYDAFNGCTSLTSVTIPNSVTSIEYKAFHNCTNLTSVISETENPCSIDEYCFSENVFDKSPLYVPKGTIDKYKSTNFWNKFLHIIEGSPFEHTLTYLVDGETYSTYTLEEGDAITPEEAPTKEGYTFSGWSEIPETMPASDVTITGTFVPNKYKLMYIVDGVEYKSSEIEFGSTIAAEENPTKEGYTFSGWSEIPSTMPASDVTITGSFSVNKYKLTYTLNGKEYKTTELDYGTALTPEEAPVKEGYTFSGWSDIPETMPSNDVTITGTFTVNKYKLTYMVDGEEFKASEVDYGTAITAETVPTKEGYTFSGWSEIPSTMPASDVTISGTFTINKYKLTYTVDGKVFKSSVVEFGSTITAEDNPTKEGYTFSGWSEIPETMPASDVNITGTFTINKYKLTYMVDGVEYKSYEVEFGATITPEASPANEGQTFSGWSEIPATMPANDVVITGTFSDNSYKLTYMVDGEVFKSSHVEYGSTITPETPPTKDGYTFSGWSEIPETMPASDVTIIGSFTVNKYNLTYKVDGVDYKTTQIEYGSAITPEAIPTKEGYTFSGWSDIPETMPASDVTITGTFNINKYKLTYMVDGIEYKSYEVEFGATITPEASPANEGQTFSGWSEIPATMPANDVVITGTFSDNSYKLTYMVDGEVFKSSHVEYGSTITPETPPTKEGYTFSGWSEIPTTMPASDVTISGTFTPNKYKLTYTVDGVEYKTAEVDCGAAITPEDNPTKEGYTFSGWSEIPETMPASDVTITGTFTINKYTITYMVDNALLTTEEVTYGSTITPPASPKEGYEITWNSHPTTMPAYDVTIYGSYISTGINGIYAEESDKKVYTPDGKRVQSPKKGMNIIRMSDGTIKKVVVK